MEPCDLPQKWLSQVKGMTLTPIGLAGTCTLGVPRMYDYVVHSRDLEGVLDLYPDLYSSTRPHISLVLQMAKRPRKMMVRKLVGPKEFPIVQYLEQEKKKQAAEEARKREEARRVAEEAKNAARNRGGKNSREQTRLFMSYARGLETTKFARRVKIGRAHV